MQIVMTRWTIEEVTGYKPKTTFWTDFCIAEAYGLNAIQDTYNRAFNEWKTDTEYVTELAMVLNHKIWYFYDRKEMEIANLYDKLWRETDEWCMNHLKGKDLAYYIQTTD